MRTDRGTGRERGVRGVRSVNALYGKNCCPARTVTGR